MQNPVSFAGIDESAEPPCDILERLVPRSRNKSSLALAPDSLKRATKPDRLIPPSAIIGNRAFAAQDPLGNSMI
jgi:hypothetical protein